MNNIVKKANVPWRIQLRALVADLALNPTDALTEKCRY